MDGPINVTVNLAKRFNSTFGTAELLVPSYPQRVEVQGLTIHRCFSVRIKGGYRAGLPFLNRKIKRLILSGGFDVIHLQSPFVMAKYVLRLAKRKNIPVVITVHTKFKEEFEKRFKSRFIINFLTHYIINRIDGCTAITSVSNGMSDVLKSYGSCRFDEVKIIPNASDMPLLGADRERTAEIKRLLNLEDRFAFLFVGRLTPVKNIQFSLSVLKGVKERGISSFAFVIVGDGEYEGELKRLVKKYDLTCEVAFVGRVTDREELACYYSACQTLLFPSTFDSYGLAVAEAAANALPTATVKGSCAAERLLDGVSGFVWEYNEGVWIDNIIKLISHPEVAKAVGVGASQKVYADWQGVTKQYVALYKSLLCDI